VSFISRRGSFSGYDLPCCRHHHESRNFLNQGQVPVQSLYAIAKKVQWNFPTAYGEKNLVLMFGGFHTELAALKLLGSWIEDGAGCTSVLA